GPAATLRAQGRFEEALAVPAGARAGCALRLARGWTLSVAGRFDEAAAVLGSALSAAGDREDDVVGHLLLQLAWAERAGGGLGAALAHALDAERIFQAEQDLRGLATALRIEGSIYFAVERLADAPAALPRRLAAARVGNVEEVAGCLLGLGMVELSLGHVETAIEFDRRAGAEFERIGHGSGRAGAYGNLAEKLLAAGDLDGAIDEASRALALAEEIGHTPTVADVQRTRARILLRQGRDAEAAVRAEAAAQAFRAMGAEAEAEDALNVVATT